VRAAATAATIGQHAAQVLQRSARQFVSAFAVDLESASAFFELHFAARYHAPVASRGRSRRETGSLPRRRRSRLRSDRESFHQYSTRHEELLSFGSSFTLRRQCAESRRRTPCSHFRLAKKCRAASGGSSERRDLARLFPPAFSGQPYRGAI
jgi:hypothetical protein